MRLKPLLVSLALAAAGGATTAGAADLVRYGGIKDYRGVPVPAPRPYAETFKWYLRADAGGGWVSEPDVKEDGLMFGLDRMVAEGPPFGMNSAWFNPDFDTFAVGGVGAGAYLSPRFRADVTVDVRTKSTIDAYGSYTYTIEPTPALPNHRINATVRDHTDVRTTLALANVYWDLAERGSRLVPYIGAGVGFAVRSLDRRHSTYETTFDMVANAPIGTTEITGKSKAHQLAPAASVTAGVGYTLGPGMVIDLNYRYAYIGDVDFSTGLSLGRVVAGTSSAESRMTLGETHEHTIRAGVRWNVW
jgi:opacity protein-like surface antigen